MHLVYIHQYFVTSNSAGGTRSYEFAKRMVRDGLQVSLITANSLDMIDGNKEGAWWVHEVDGIKVYALNLNVDNRTGYVRRMMKFIQFSLMSIWKVIRLAPDIILATSTPLTVGVPALVARLLFRIPFIFEVRDVWPKIPIALGVLKNPMLKWLAYKLESVIYHFSSHIIALSPGMAKDIKSRFPGIKNLTVIPNASDLELFCNNDAQFVSDWLSRYGLVPGCKYGLYAGTFGYVNNLSYLLELSKELESRKICFPIVLLGDGREREELEEKISKWNLQYVFIAEPVPKKQMAIILANASLAFSTVLPIEELWENSANKFFDALGAGVPIAINHYGWQADIINEYNCGLVMPFDSPTAAAEIILAHLQDSQLATEMKKNAKNVAIDLFSREKLYLELYAVVSGIVNYRERNLCE